MKSIILGAHSLSFRFTLAVKHYMMLKNAMRATVARGGRMFEIPYLLCSIPWERVAQVAKLAGIKEIALCHFWPIKPDGTSVCGDPLGNTDEVNRALATLDKIIDAVKILRAGGITVRFIDGPTWGGLGHDYTALPPEEKFRRAVSFLKLAGDKCRAADLFLAVEFLRPSEDKVVGGTADMIRILEAVDHQFVKMHFDVFHSISRGENVAESIRLAAKWIVYLHLHGDLRIAPGATGDMRDWPLIVEAIRTIDSGVDNIPGISEPFGKDTIEEEPTLGEGLPVPPPLTEYLDQAYETFRQAGLPIAA